MQNRSNLKLPPLIELNKNRSLKLSTLKFVIKTLAMPNDFFLKLT